VLIVVNPLVEMPPKRRRVEPAPEEPPDGASSSDEDCEEQQQASSQNESSRPSGPDPPTTAGSNSNLTVKNKYNAKASKMQVDPAQQAAKQTSSMSSKPKPIFLAANYQVALNTIKAIKSTHRWYPSKPLTR
jgi:hypothetical protein